MTFYGICGEQETNSTTNWGSTVSTTGYWVVDWWMNDDWGSSNVVANLAKGWKGMRNGLAVLLFSISFLPIMYSLLLHKLNFYIISSKNKKVPPPWFFFFFPEKIIKNCTNIFFLGWKFYMVFHPFVNQIQFSALRERERVMIFFFFWPNK